MGYLDQLNNIELPKGVKIVKARPCLKEQLSVDSVPVKETEASQNYYNLFRHYPCKRKTCEKIQCNS